MDHMKQCRRVTHRAPGSAIAAAAVAIGGLTASLFAAGTSGAVTSHATKGVVVSTIKYPKLGTILVSGKTLYTLQPSKTACAAACLKIWHELVLPKGVTKATAGTGVSASKLGTIMRANGVRQVTYNGKALYSYSLDKSTGTTGRVSGNLKNTWGKWSDVVIVKPTSGSGASTAGSGGVAF